MSKVLFPHISYLFCSDLENKVLGDDKLGHDVFMVMKKQTIRLAIREEVFTFVVQDGFLYDGASVPGIATFLGSIKHYQLDSNSTLKNQSALHDLLYIYRGHIDLDNPYLHVYNNGYIEHNVRVEIKLSRGEVDWIYYLGLEWEQEQLLLDKDNVTKTRSMSVKETWSVYQGLKNFGWTKWNKKVAKVLTRISTHINNIRKFFTKKT